MPCLGITYCVLEWQQWRLKKSSGRRSFCQGCQSLPWERNCARQYFRLQVEGWEMCQRQFYWKGVSLDYYQTSRKTRLCGTIGSKGYSSSHHWSGAFLVGWRSLWETEDSWSDRAFLLVARLWSGYFFEQMCAVPRDSRSQAIPDKTAETVCKAFFESWICRHRVPAAIVSDREKEFLNSMMTDLCGYLGIDHNATSSYHPQAETYCFCFCFCRPSTKVSPLRYGIAPGVPPKRYPREHL